MSLCSTYRIQGRTASGRALQRTGEHPELGDALGVRVLRVLPLGLLGPLSGVREDLLGGLSRAA
ncbi:hypothetical protein [Streptomyces sp. NPDC003480]